MSVQVKQASTKNVIAPGHETTGLYAFGNALFSKTIVEFSDRRARLGCPSKQKYYCRFVNPYGYTGKVQRVSGAQCVLALLGATQYLKNAIGTIFQLQTT